MKQQEIKRKVFNDSGVRQSLRNCFPVVDRLESLDSLRDLEVTGISVRPWDDHHLVWYEAVATDGLFPHVRSRLIERGVATPKHISLYRRSGKGFNYEFEEVDISYSGIQIALKVHNPDYNR